MSTWYRTGTVSVTNGSKNVVGTGTAWSVMISVGDVFTLDNSILYEIQTITDDLHIVLDRNYEGTTATDQTYTIIPWSVKRSLNSEILDRINKLLEWAHEIFVTQWTTDTNGDYEVSTTLDKNVVPKVNNGASLGTTLKKWAKAYLTALSINGVDILPTTTPTALGIPVADANGDIDSGWLKDTSATVKGVVKVGSNISVANGVISVPDATDTVKGVVELATSAEVLAGTDTERAVTPDTLTDKILGTVSEVDGVPTGAVIESGSNANGSYTKFADGTMICYKIITTPETIEIATAWGSFYVSANIGLGNWAATFTATPVISYTCNSGSSFFILPLAIHTATSAGAVIAARPITDTSRQRSFNVIGIGRWF